MMMGAGAILNARPPGLSIGSGLCYKKPMENRKRKDTRAAASVEISYEHRGHCLNDRIADLSSGGFYIDTIHPLPENSVISFRFALPGDESETPVSGEGEVAWIQRMQGMGIRITRMSDEDRKRLEAYLARSERPVSR